MLLTKKVVKDVRVTTQQQNLFRIKTSRSQSPARLADNSIVKENTKVNRQDDLKTIKKEKGDLKKSKLEKNKLHLNEEDESQNPKVKVIKVEKKIGNNDKESKRNGNNERSNEEREEQQVKTMKKVKNNQGDNNQSNIGDKILNGSQEDIKSLKLIQNENTQLKETTDIGDKSKNKQTKKKKEQEEDFGDIFNGLSSINQTKSITNIGKIIKKSNKIQKTNILLPSIQKSMIITDNFEEKKGLSKGQITENSKRKKSEEKSKKKKELDKQLQLKKKKKEIERVQKQKEEERLRLEKQRRREEEAYLKIEKDRLKLEEGNVEELNDFYHHRQISLFKKVRQKESWDYTIQCNQGKLRLHNKLELDSYRYQIEHNLIFDKCQSIEEYLFKLQKTLDNFHDIENYLVRLTGEEKVQDELDWYSKLLSSLKEIILQKIQDLHIRILQYSDSLQEEKRLECNILVRYLFSLLIPTYQQALRVQNCNYLLSLLPLKRDKRVKYMFWLNPVGRAGLRIKPVEFIQTKVSVEVPRPYIQSKIVMTGFWIELDYSQSQYSHLLSLGGVFHFQLFELPQLPKVYKRFTLKFQKENMDDIVELFYPDKFIDKRDLTNFQNFLPIKISYQIPNYITLPETLQIGLWDENLGWQTDQVQDIKFEEEQRLISFSANKFLPFSLVQSRCEDYPYKQWQMRSVAANSAKIDLLTKRFFIKLLITGNQIELVDINQHYLLDKIKGIKLPVYQFLQELKRCGINLMPQSNDAMISDLLIKDKDCLDQALNDISKAISGFYFKSSKWNKTIGVNQQLAYIRYNPEYDEQFIENQEKDWILTTWYANKVGFYKTNEKDKEFNTKYLKNTETRSNFYLAVKQLGLEADELSERMKDSSYYEFWSSMREFLYLTQILGYTQ